MKLRLYTLLSFALISCALFFAIGFPNPGSSFDDSSSPVPNHSDLQCQRDSDCSYGQTCTSGTCSDKKNIQAVCISLDGETETFCGPSEDCCMDGTCKPAGSCLSNCNITGCAPGFCCKDESCRPLEECNNGTDECHANSECSSGKTCCNGSCIAELLAASTTGCGTDTECQDDSDCSGLNTDTIEETKTFICCEGNNGKSTCTQQDRCLRTCSKKSQDDDLSGCRDNEICCFDENTITTPSNELSLYETILREEPAITGGSETGVCKLKEDCGCNPYMDEKGHIVYPEDCAECDDLKNCCICQFMKRKQCDIINDRKPDDLSSPPEPYTWSKNPKTKQEACEKIRSKYNIILDCDWIPNKNSKNPEEDGECISRFENYCRNKTKEWREAGFCDLIHSSDDTSDELDNWTNKNSCDVIYYERDGHGRGTDGAECPLQACISCSSKGGNACKIIHREYGCETFQNWEEVLALVERIRARLKELGGGEVILTADRGSTTDCLLTPVTIIITVDDSTIDYGDCSEILSNPQCLGLGERATCEDKNGNPQELLCCNAEREGTNSPKKRWTPIDPNNPSCPYKNKDCDECTATYSGTGPTDVPFDAVNTCIENKRQACEAQSGTFETEIWTTEGEPFTVRKKHCCITDTADSPYACPIGKRKVLWEKTASGHGYGDIPQCLDNATTSFLNEKSDFKKICSANDGTLLFTPEYHKPSENTCSSDKPEDISHSIYSKALCCVSPDNDGPFIPYPDNDWCPILLGAGFSRISDWDPNLYSFTVGKCGKEAEKHRNCDLLKICIMDDFLEKIEKKKEECNEREGKPTLIYQVRSKAHCSIDKNGVPNYQITAKMECCENCVEKDKATIQSPALIPSETRSKAFQKAPSAF